MKILFCLRSTVYARNFESTLRMLAEHGHDVHIVADRHWADSDDLVRRLCDGYPSIHYSEPPIVPFNAWSFFGSELRAGIDYLRYLGPEFADAAGVANGSYVDAKSPFSIADDRLEVRVPVKAGTHLTTATLIKSDNLAVEGIGPNALPIWSREHTNKSDNPLMVSALLIGGVRADDVLELLDKQRRIPEVG